ncbi:MAG: hypothetical protein V4620_03310 [Bacteroidota bacterium]
MSTIIEINQCLHGYKEGHQLLASSSDDLSPQTRKNLLFQTDLSGSYVDDGFDVYITGYPLDEENLYAFSKTWYANEMKRPGCVWTHTLLISFSDIGKIPEFSGLIELFKRPLLNEYQFYSNVVRFDLSPLLKVVDNVIDEGVNRSNLLCALYENPENTVILISESSIKYEEATLKIWSDQWPRLRRRFTFCTGALGLKKTQEKEFDLQITPEQNSLVISRQSQAPYIVDTKEQKSNWLKVLYKTPKQSLRRFLWTYSSDITGERSNYIPLLRVYEILYSDKWKLSELCSIMLKYFPSLEDAKLLKKDIFSKNKNQSIEKQIIEFLLISRKINFVDLSLLNLEERLIDILTNETITFKEFLGIIKKADSNLITKKIWDKIPLENIDFVGLLNEHDDFINILVEKSPEFANNAAIWQLDYSLQSQVFNTLLNSQKDIDWNTIMISALSSRSAIVFDIINKFGNEAIYTIFNWLNSRQKSRKLWPELEKYLMLANESGFKKWLKFKEEDRLDTKIFDLIFKYWNMGKILDSGISAKAWIDVYKEIKASKFDYDFINISCLLLSIGLDNRVKHSDKLVAETFNNVYILAANSKIESKHWYLIPKEMEEEDDELYPFVNLFALFGFSSQKKKRQVPSWDYCEFLIRTVSNKFIKYSWPKQSFLDTTTSEIVFNRVIDYCLSTKKGITFLRELNHEIKNGKVKPHSFQKKLIYLDIPF